MYALPPNWAAAYPYADACQAYENDEYMPDAHHDDPDLRQRAAAPSAGHSEEACGDRPHPVHPCFHHHRTPCRIK